MVLLDILILFLFCGLSTAQSESCDDLVKYYSGFEQLIGQTVEYHDPFGTIFKVSICANTIAGCGTCEVGGNAGYCEIWEDEKKRDMNHNEEGYESCIGVFEKAQPITVGAVSGIELSYHKGQFGSKKGALTMMCNPEAGKMAKIQVSDLSGKFMTLESAYVCRSGGGTSGGTIFCILLLVGAILYLIGGALYNKFVMQHEVGLGLIPQLEFWQEFPWLVKEGCLFLYHKITGAGGN